MGGPTTVRIKTTGMHCHSCEMMIQMGLDDLEGVVSAKADSAAGETEVTYDPDTVGVDDIVAAITAAGYGAEAPAA